MAQARYSDLLYLIESAHGKPTSPSFRLLVELNHWNHQERATYLAISLQDSTLTVLTNISEEQISLHCLQHSETDWTTSTKLN